jgi:WD40 repeat protein
VLSQQEIAVLKLKTSKDDALSYDILCVTFSSDGKTIVSGSDDFTIKVWDAGYQKKATEPPLPRSPLTLSVPSW